MVTLTLVSNGFVFILESTFKFSLQSLIYLYQLCPKGGWVVGERFAYKREGKVNNSFWSHLGNYGYFHS